MSLIRIIIADESSVLTGELHGSEADRIVASLTAEPETIAELELAARRFRNPESDWPMARWFKRSELNDPETFLDPVELEPYDAGIVIIDLAGRTILVDSTYSDPAPYGEIKVEDRLSNEDISFPIHYELSGDWKVFRSRHEYKYEAKAKRKERLANEKVDYRTLLYGSKLIEFLVTQIADKELPLRHEEVIYIHASWLLGEQDALKGKSPRNVLLERVSFIDMDLQSRSLQFSFSKEEPLAIEKSTDAYKYAGFGTHEIVVYYDLVRWLIEGIAKRFETKRDVDVEREIELGFELMNDWLNTPNQEYSNRIPKMICELERTRQNIAMDPSEVIIDEDCPICIEMASMFDTPTFWHLDGGHFDDHFAFSFHETIEEWEKEKAAWEDFHSEQIRKDILGLRGTGQELDDPEDFIRIMRSGRH